MTQIRQADIDRFTTGDCHIFARALNKATGWPIYAFQYGREPDVHAFVLAPDGRPVDIEGFHTIEGFIEKWGSDPFREFSWSDFKRFWGGPDYGKYSYDRARKLVPLVLAAA